MKQGSIIRDENGIALGAKIVVRIPRSHRKRNRFEGLLGRRPQYLYSFRFAGHFTYLDGDEYERVKPLVTRPRIDTSKLLQCWS